MIEVVCPGCGKNLSASEKLAGKKVRCPQCKSVVEIPEAGAAPAESVRWLDCPCGNATGIENATAGMRASCKCGRQFVLADSGFIEVAAGPPAHIATAHAIEPARASSILRNKPLLAAAGGAVVLAAVVIALFSGGGAEPEKASAPAAEPVAEAEREPPAEGRALVRRGIEPERDEPVVERPAAKAKEEAPEPPPAPPVEPEPRAEAAAVEPEPAVTAAPPPEAKSLADVMEEVARSVVMVRRRRGHGSGFLVKAPAGDAWYVATNRHVIEGALELKVFGFRGKEKVELPGAKLHAVHKDADLALLSIDAPPPGFEPFRFGDPGGIRQGDEIFTYGSPGGVEADKVLEQTATNGIVSARGREVEGQRCFQITAAVNPGNSGGPLFTRTGEVVGINTYSTALEGTNFALEVDYLLELLRGEESLPEEEVKELVRRADPMRARRKRTLLAEAKVKQPVTKLLVDAKREKLVALVSAENSIILYELPELAEAGRLFVGSDPVDFDYDAASARAVVSLASPPQVAVFDVEKMKRVSVAETKTPVYAIRWLRRGVAVVARKDTVPASAAAPEVDVLRVSLVSTSNGRFLGDFKNGALSKEGREARMQIDAVTGQMRFRSYAEAEAAGRILGFWKARVKTFETAFWSPTLGVSPDRRTLVIVEPDEGGRVVFKLGTTSTVATPRQLKGQVHLFLPSKEERYDPRLPVVFGRKGKLAAVGDGVCDLVRGRIVGAVKKVEWVWEERRELCNIFAVDSDALHGFTGTHVFDLRKFVPVARLPLKSRVMAVGPEDKVLYAFDERRYAIVALSVEKLLAEGMGGATVDVEAEREQLETLAKVIEDLILRDKFKKARSRAEELVKLYPRSARAHVLLAEALLGEGDAERAERAARKALALEAKNARAAELLASAVKALREGWERTVAAAREKAVLKPGDSEVVERFASLLLQAPKEQYEAVSEAMGFAEGLVSRTRREDQGALTLLARVRLYAGDFEGAEKLAREAKRLDPGDEECRRVLKAAAECTRGFDRGLKLVRRADFESQPRAGLRSGTLAADEHGAQGVIEGVDHKVQAGNAVITANGVKLAVDFGGGLAFIVARVKVKSAPGSLSTALSRGPRAGCSYARPVPGRKWWPVKQAVYAPPKRNPYDTLWLYVYERERGEKKLLVDEVALYELQETFAKKRVIWRDLCDTVRAGEGEGRLTFRGPEGTRGGAVVFSLGPGTTECGFATCRHGTSGTLGAVRYFVRSAKRGSLSVGRSAAGVRFRPIRVDSTPGGWREAVVPLERGGKTDTDWFGFTAEGFDPGDALYVDEVRLLEK